MKKSKLINRFLVIALIIMSTITFAQIKTPAPSPAGSTSGTIGLTDIEINYFRPQMKGRKIFGEGDKHLQPFGIMWRAGANQGTKIKFSTDVKVGDTDLLAGEYLFLATPGKDSWTTIFYTDVKMGGNLTAFKEENVAARVTVKPSKLTETVSTLSYQITDISEDSQKANIELSWENTSVKVPITVSFDDQVMKAIAAGTTINIGNYATAAGYYLSTGKDLNKALEWMNLYMAEGENSKQFWHVHTKAKILAKLGNKKAAKATAIQSMEIAKKNDGGDFGYIKLNEDLISSL
ncbi:MAG: DUF2911 domain-containing protein [Cyclobacteriaceae bacterium]|jgi:hypothetical protein|nr:DUF2911 domain-containing protein [Cyclobacteriaceae bacterium]